MIKTIIILKSAKTAIQSAVIPSLFGAIWLLLVFMRFVAKQSLIKRQNISGDSLERTEFDFTFSEI